MHPASFHQTGKLVLSLNSCFITLPSQHQHRRNDAADASVLTVCASAARCNAASTAPVTKWNSVFLAMDRGTRAWCLSTNTGVWKGGFSPHQPFHSSSGQLPRTGPSMLRPMIQPPQCRIPARQNRRQSLLSRCSLQGDRVNLQSRASARVYRKPTSSVVD